LYFEHLVITPDNQNEINFLIRSMLLDQQESATAVTTTSVSATTATTTNDTITVDPRQRVRARRALGGVIEVDSDLINMTFGVNSVTLVRDPPLPPPSTHKHTLTL
jgi:hypothetical protein